MKSVSFSTCTKLPCIGTSLAPVILCLNDDVELISDFNTLSALLVSSVQDACSCPSIWTYIFSYDEGLLEEDQEALVPGDIAGVFCEDCFTDWIKNAITESVLFDNNCEAHVSTWDELEAAAESDTGTIVVCASITLEESLDINCGLRFTSNGLITTDGNILSINGPLAAGAQQIFVTSGSEVVFGAGSTDNVLLEWFGALGDGVTNDTTAIQLAINLAAAAHLTVMPLVKTYSITTIAAPRAANIITQNPKRSSAVFKARTAVPMFTVTSISDAFVTLEGVVFDSNSIATAAISVVNSDNVYIKRCGFTGVQGKCISIDGGIFIHIDNCELLGSNPSDSSIYLTGFSAAVYIDRCNIASSSSNYGVYADSNWLADAITISDCTFGSANNIAAINLQGNSGVISAKSVIRNCRVDQHASTAHIIIGRYAWQIEITGCSLVDSAPYNVLCDAGHITISANWLAQASVAAIGLTTNSNFCEVGFNTVNASPVYVLDTSLYQGYLHSNKVHRNIRKGATADRTNGIGGGSAFGQYEFGAMYLDTDLDADGKPIWWNGVAWIDATGAVV